jgi:hypothetical protein
MKVPDNILESVGLLEPGLLKKAGYDEPPHLGVFVDWSFYHLNGFWVEKIANNDHIDFRLYEERLFHDGYDIKYQIQVDQMTWETVPEEKMRTDQMLQLMKFYAEIERIFE